MNIKRAFISVHNKSGVEKIAGYLASNGVEIVATDHTAEYLIDHGINAIKVADYTGFPSILDGRLKAIHPRIIGGILAIQDLPSHMTEMKEHSILPFDIIILNLKPFESAVKKSPDELNLSKEIDVSGPALLMAGAKNHRDIVVISDPTDYDEVIESLEECGDVLLLKRRRYALKAIYAAMLYNSSIHKALSQIFASEKYDYTVMEHVMQLLYGDNPSQKAYLLKLSKEPGLLDEVQIGNPAVGLKKSQLRNMNVFMELYYYSDNISVFLDKGKITKVFAGKLRDGYSEGGPDTMFASTFAIDGDTIKKLHEGGVEAFGGVFDRDAILAARERDIMILTAPAHEAVSLSEETYSGFGNYFVRELSYKMKDYDLENDDKLALFCSRVNRANNLSIFREGESALLKSGLSYTELMNYDFEDHDLQDSVMASDNDLTDEVLARLKAAGVRRMILPGTRRTYSHKSVLVLGIDFTRLNN
ncbi:phosphoribosylaminoimidazolecarboxamide formyltransferase [Mesotoga sp. Brook.08.YT.4.2.5.1]|jgi:phosphoribosylaminoimidazolecarboxamide formyltransferase/IMP cyclohydrolase|uniref:AICAR transformylase/IMP cyclohydrolase PurH n=1 Tax=Mesotoga prima TaxID=1184387 RepID=A0A124FYV4_9BACT|nr:MULTISPECIES: phosphoribosylaminoimidazolecarboxamide formyltransferase [unclassified Mesotoga]KUK82362.1 MAG: AICAR transformylase/IMP cyclohydrolase PurH [Mesotoga prima]RAM61073.1 phosphoribosylaminoimidazolecarboxamide formyltransferase [Mesotoga sp. SC_4PWA21]PNE23235.1 phosphoribosylaminoimidazolecarboxamide formyltransferase [Mesotoga sp. Brook.08.YT.4.2.5.1]PVD17252.1 IMP cyclohydrolase [Mesotoga sp. Brook.08.105.5.1]RAO97995.1 hypothetical protein M388_07985 [Mesotoga sp. Brook.08.